MFSRVRVPRWHRSPAGLSWSWRPRHHAMSLRSLKLVSKLDAQQAPSREAESGSLSNFRFSGPLLGALTVSVVPWSLRCHTRVVRVLLVAGFASVAACFSVPRAAAARSRPSLTLAVDGSVDAVTAAG